MTQSRNQAVNRVQPIVDQMEKEAALNGEHSTFREGRNAAVKTAAEQAEGMRAGLPQQLATALWKRLPFARREAFGFADLAQAASQYVASLYELQAVRTETQSFLIAVCRTNFSTRWRGTEMQVAAKIGAAELTRFEKEWQLPPQAMDKTLSANLGSSELSEAVTALKLALKRYAGQLAKELVALLSTGVEQQRIGIIEWPSADACEFYFYRHLVLGTAVKKRTISTTETSRKRIKGRHGHAAIKEETTVAREQKYEVRNARHEQHLLGATRHVLGAFSGSIPLSHKALVETVPGWLAPFVEVVEGQRVRERILEQCKEEKALKWTTKTESERVVYVGDPAVILGPFVLSGWGSESELPALDR